MKILKKILFPLFLVVALTACGKEPEVPKAEIPVKKSEGLKAGKIETDDVQSEELAQEIQKETEQQFPQPAQLEGVWLLESGEVEGDVWEAQPGQLESMIFESVLKDDGVVLAASCQKRNYWDEQIISDYNDVSTTILDEPVYSGCGNEEWSVLVGDYSELNENGYPIKTETYVTLLDENTMLRRLYYSFDGGPGVSHQIFKRIVSNISEIEFEPIDLEGGDYDCVSYTDKDGNTAENPQGMEDFYVHLDVNSEMTVNWWNEAIGEMRSFNGTWLLGRNGVINLISENYDGESEFTDACWFAGAIRGIRKESTEKNEYEPEMYLYYDGGIIHLKHNAGSGGENFDDGYEDSMGYFEGNAFAAPPEALFVLYGENAYMEYIDESFEIVPHYNLSSNDSNSKKILITAVLDNTLFWYEDENSAEVWSENLNAGESVVLKVDVPETAKEVLCININDEVTYYYEISTDTVYADECYYITGI